MFYKSNVNQKGNITNKMKIDYQFENKKTIAKKSGRVYNMGEKMRKIGEVYE